MTQAKQIANAFSAVLRRWFSDEEMAEVIARNRAEDNPDVDHSHDLCDANMAMEEAFISVTGREPKTTDTVDNDLWMDAWDIAQVNEFKEAP